MGFNLTVNGKIISAEPGETILEAALREGIYIPNLCYHPDLPPSGEQLPVDAVFRGEDRFVHTEGSEPYGGCGLCVVEVNGQDKPVRSCATNAEEGMAVKTDTDALNRERKKRLKELLTKHPHACLTCAQKEGCTREPCSTNVPVEERCCPNWGHCEVQKISEFVGIPEDTPRWIPTALPVLKEPLFDRDYNLCIGCTRCVRACRELRGIEAIGYVIDDQGRVVVGSVAPDLKESGCRFCTACVEVCPTGALTDRDLKFQDKTSALVPCRSECPAGIDIPNYLRLIAQGREQDAAAVIRQSVPLPNVLGAVCFHPCEEVCRRGDVSDPIAVCALKRFALENSEAGLKPISVPAPSKPGKVAIAGGGPAGLTAAYYLHMKGRAVTIFEAESELGGMLRWGIPEYRLPKDVLARDIDPILNSGVAVEYGKRVGTDIKIQDLKERFDAVFIAVGATESRSLPIPGADPGVDPGADPGADNGNVLLGVDFLKKCRSEGMQPALYGKVVVIGGGNVAIDVALSARRLGGESVELVCLERREEMPAHEWECEDALAEGIVFHNGWGPKEIRLEGEKARRVGFIRCVSVFDGKGRFDPKYDESETTALDADWVILAIGQAVDLSCLNGDGGQIQKGPGGTISVDPESMATSVPGVFAGGDAAKMPGSVVDAVAAGKKAASAIDLYLGGDGDILETWIEIDKPDPKIGRIEGFAGEGRLAPPCVIPSERKGFEPIELPYDVATARKEAARCLQCDLRLFMQPVVLPPEEWLAFTEENLLHAPETDGVYLLLDESKQIYAIKGVINIREALEEKLGEDEKARYFLFEEDKMFTKRETELIQMHGLTGGDDDLDDLF